MKGLAAGLLVVLAFSAPLGAQARDPSLERISLKLQQPPLPIERGLSQVEADFPKKFGIFTLVAPIKRGEMIRISIPVGEFASRAYKGVAAANHRRQQKAAQRKVAAELKALEEQRLSTKR